MVDSAAVKERYFELAMRAAQEGDLVELERLLSKQGIGINQRNSREETLLHRAAQSGNPTVVRFLLDKGADANAVNKFGNTPLGYLFSGASFSPDVADILVTAGADVHYTHKGSGLTNKTASNRTTKPEALAWLEQKGVNININGTNTFDHPIFFAMQNQNLPVVKAYLSRGFDLTTLSNEGLTLLHAALIKTGEGQSVQFPNPNSTLMLIDEAKKRGIDIVNRATRDGLKPIHQVAQLVELPLKKEDIQTSTKQQLILQARLMNILVENGADVNAINEGGFTPLMLAANTGNLELANYLLSKGADPKVVSKNGYTAYAIAALGGYNDVARALGERMAADVSYKANSPSLPQLDANGLAHSLVAYGTSVPVYTLNRKTEEFRDDSSATLSPLSGFKQQRRGYLMVNETEGVHQVGTFYSALNTYTRLTGANRYEAEQHIMPLNLLMENLGNFGYGTAPTSQYPQGFRALMESDKNEGIRKGLYFSASYGARDESSLFFKQERAKQLREAEQFYGGLNLAGVGIAGGNDAGEPNFDTLGDSQPFRRNPGTLFIGAARKNADGSVAMESYSTQGPHISALLPPYYDKLGDTLKEGTSFSAPAFNAYRLAIYNGTANLTPREIDAVLMTTASQKVVSPDAGKPYVFASNGVIGYNEKVGAGVADPAKAYARAVELDAQKKLWLEKNGEDKPISFDISAANLKAPKRIEVKGAAKYEYTLTVPETVYVQQLASKTLTKLGDDGKLLASHARVVLPSGFTQHARQDAYGNATLPAMFGAKLNKGDTVKIISDQPLTEAALNINGYAPNSFFAMMMNQEMAKRAAAKMNGVTAAETCAVVSSTVFNAKAAECKVR